MAANTFNLKINSITLSAINIAIPNRTSTTNLTGSNIIIQIYNSSNNNFNPFIAFALSNLSADATNGSTATITPTNAFLETDVLLIEIVDGSDKSDLTAIDFKNPYTNGIAQLDFEIPSDSGNYNLQILGNDDNTFTTPTTSIDAFNSIQPLDPTQSSIELIDSKPYLAKYAGKTYTIRITLKDSNGTVVSGNQELIFRTRKN